jgi:hypothetical protein
VWIVSPYRKSLVLECVRTKKGIASGVDDPAVGTPRAETTVVDDLRVEKVVGAVHQHRNTSPCSHIGRVSIGSSRRSRVETDICALGTWKIYLITPHIQ